MPTQKQGVLWTVKYPSLKKMLYLFSYVAKVCKDALDVRQFFTDFISSGLLHKSFTKLDE